jgi:predicted hydrocarbon binding protein
MAEQQTPGLVGTPAEIFGRPIISSLAQGITRTRGAGGERLLHQLGRDAGTLAASALPPLLEKLDLSINVDLLTQRIRDLQVVKWATVRRATVSDELRGEVTLVDTFEADAWKGQGGSPKCHFLSGFMAEAFSFAWQRPFDCRETECRAAGTAVCHFALQPSDA